VLFPSLLAPDHLRDQLLRHSAEQTVSVSGLRRRAVRRLQRRQHTRRRTAIAAGVVLPLALLLIPVNPPSAGAATRTITYRVAAPASLWRGARTATVPISFVNRVTVDPAVARPGQKVRVSLEVSVEANFNSACRTRYPQRDWYYGWVQGGEGSRESDYSDLKDDAKDLHSPRFFPVRRGNPVEMVHATPVPWPIRVAGKVIHIDHRSGKRTSCERVMDWAEVDSEFTVPKNGPLSRGGRFYVNLLSDPAYLSLRGYRLQWWSPSGHATVSGTLPILQVQECTGPTGWIRCRFQRFTD